MAERRQTESGATVYTTDFGDIVSEHPNGDKVRVHVSRFHGLVVTAMRDYIGTGRKEVSAYFADPQALVDWLASEGYVPTSPGTTGGGA